MHAAGDGQGRPLTLSDILRGILQGCEALRLPFAKAHQVPLLTADRRLARAPGPKCRIEVLRPTTERVPAFGAHLSPSRVNARSDGAKAGSPWPTRGPLGPPTGPWRTVEIGGVPGQTGHILGFRRQIAGNPGFFKSPLGHQQTLLDLRFHGMGESSSCPTLVEFGRRPGDATNLRPPIHHRSPGTDDATGVPCRDNRSSGVTGVGNQDKPARVDPVVGAEPVGCVIGATDAYPAGLMERRSPVRRVLLDASGNSSSPTDAGPFVPPIRSRPRDGSDVRRGHRARSSPGRARGLVARTSPPVWHRPVSMRRRFPPWQDPIGD